MVEKASELSGVAFIKVLLPVMREEPPKGCQSPLKGPASRYQHTENQNITYEYRGGHRHSVYNRGPELSHLYNGDNDKFVCAKAGDWTTSSFEVPLEARHKDCGAEIVRDVSPKIRLPGAE